MFLNITTLLIAKIFALIGLGIYVVFALVIVTFIMVVYVLPQLLTIFEEAGIENLPLTTRMLMWITSFINTYLYYLIIGMAVLIYSGWTYILTPAGQAWLDNAKIKFPSLGPVIRNLYLARIAESLSTLIKAGIPILDSIQITSDLV